jgi:hypothetical protein
MDDISKKDLRTLMYESGGLKFLFFVLVFFFVILIWSLENFFLKGASICVLIFLYYRFIKHDKKNDFKFKEYFSFKGLAYVVLYAIVLYTIYGFSTKFAILFFIMSIAVFGLVVVVHSIIKLYRSYSESNFVFLYILSVFLIIIFFGFLYNFLSGIDGNSLIVNDNGIADSFDFIYYSGIVFYSVGFGEIVPVGIYMRVLTIIESGINMFLHSIVIGWVISNVSISEKLKEKIKKNRKK